MPPDFPNFISADDLIDRFRNESFDIGSEFLEERSEPLRSVIAGAGGRIEFLDWDDDTVGRFFEFLLNGDYHVTTPEEESKEGEEAKRRRDAIMTPDTVQSEADWEELRVGDTSVLLIHAKVYAFAQHNARHKDGKVLESVALGKLKAALGLIDGDLLKEPPGVVVNVVKLLDYVYSHTIPDPGEPMRRYVSTFAARNFETLMDQGEMILLLQKGGDFAVDLIKRVEKRFYEVGEELYGMGQEVQRLKGQTIASDREIRQLKMEMRQNKAQEIARVQAISTEELQRIQELERLLERERALNLTLSSSTGAISQILSNWRVNIEPFIREGLDMISAVQEKWRGWFPLSLGLICTTVAVAILLALPTQGSPLPTQGSPEEKLLKAVCQRYKEYSPGDHTFFAVRGEDLEQACDGYMDIPGSQLLGILPDGGLGRICSFYEKGGWTGNYYWSSKGSSLKEDCQKKGYRKS